MEAYEAEDVETEDTCANVCGVTRVEGASNEQEALCSPAGLKATCKIYSPQMSFNSSPCGADKHLFFR